MNSICSSGAGSSLGFRLDVTREEDQPRPLWGTPSLLWGRVWGRKLSVRYWSQLQTSCRSADDLLPTAAVSQTATVPDRHPPCYQRGRAMNNADTSSGASQAHLAVEPADYGMLVQVRGSIGFRFVHLRNGVRLEASDHRRMQRHTAVDVPHMRCPS